MFAPDTRIIVVDDMRTMRTIIRKVLTGMGFSNVVDVEDGAKAWNAIKEAEAMREPFQLIVSDWTMPNLSGLDLLKKVRADAVLAKTPFLMVTAESDAAQVKEAILAGVNNYVTKPFTPDSIKLKIQAIYDKLPKKTA